MPSVQTKDPERAQREAAALPARAVLSEQHSYGLGHALTDTPSNGPLPPSGLLAVYSDSPPLWAAKKVLTQKGAVVTFTHSPLKKRKNGRVRRSNRTLGVPASYTKR